MSPRNFAKIFCHVSDDIIVFLHGNEYQSIITEVAQWLRCCATNRNVAGLIPAGVIGIFHLHKILPIALLP